MSRITALFQGKWVSRISEVLILIASPPIFFLLDILDVIMCFFFRLVDEFLEGKASSCYCLPADKTKQEDSSAVEDGESELSESLRGRRNVFREMGLTKIFSRIRSQKGPFCVEKSHRWSDCGCESCISWMNEKATDSGLLHLVVRQEERGESEQKNVILIHGFLSSSSLWEETVFQNLSEDSRRKYRLFAVDLLGFGGSPKPRDCLYTLRDHVEIIEKSVIVPFQLKSFHIVAHSMGCVIAMAVAAKHSVYVKSITLIAPVRQSSFSSRVDCLFPLVLFFIVDSLVFQPYFSASGGGDGDASAEALRRLAKRRVWPPLLFGSAFMSWYEHLGRCLCFFLCRNHRAWEWILKLLTRRRDLPFAIRDLTRHTHHSAWHTMHNVICGGAKFLDLYLEVLRSAGVKICVVQGREDQVVPVECSLNMKMKDPDIELHILPDFDHNTVISSRAEDFTRDLEGFWASADVQ